MGTTLLFLPNQVSRDSRLSRSIWFMGGLITVHADAADTNGQFALIEVTGRSGGEPPLHIHHNEDEFFYLLEGRLKVFRGTEELTLEVGDSVLLPREVPHTFKILSSSAQALVYITPAGFEEYFRALGQPAQRLEPKDSMNPPAIEKMLQVAGQLGIEFVR